MTRSNQQHPKSNDLEYAVLSPPTSGNSADAPWKERSNSRDDGNLTWNQQSNSRDDGNVPWLEAPINSSSRSSSPARKNNSASIGGSAVYSGMNQITSATVEYDSIPATELLKKAAGGALKASSKKMQSFLKFKQPAVDALHRISASSSYSYQDRRSIDSTAPSLGEL